MRDVIPDPVFDEIADHIRNRMRHAERGWTAGSAEEDTLTGDLGASLRTNRMRSTASDGTAYTWGISYKKFLAKSKRSVEKRLGADGIFQIEYEDCQTGKLVTKGLLFQSKNQWTGRNQKLLGQAQDMERFLPGGGAVFDYGPSGYRACDATVAIQRDGNRGRIANGDMLSLDEYLVSRFMECRSGTRGAYYDAARNVLLIPDQHNGFDERRFFVETRFRIEIYRLK